MEVYNIQGVNITNAVRAHTAGCTQYGIMATGMPDNILGEVTTTLRATTSTVADGGSASADLLLQKSRHLHPAYAAHTVPLTRWAQHIYMLNIDDNASNNKIVNNMKKAFEASINTIPHEKHTWAHVKGPASGVIATLLRIKWKVTTFDKWITDQGTVVELRTITPYHLSAVIKESVDSFLWETSTLRARDTPSTISKIRDKDPQDRNDIPNWALARRTVLGKDKAMGAMARSVCIYTQWPQFRIKPNDNLCRACEEWTGNLRHRQFPDGNMCCKYGEHAAKHLSTATIEHLNNGLGGNIMANHALLMKRPTPTIPTTCIS